jgi:uncharacterized protein YneF (UPF0154 family)
VGEGFQRQSYIFGIIVVFFVVVVFFGFFIASRMLG